jgi:hypothetical protein
VSVFLFSCPYDIFVISFKLNLMQTFVFKFGYKMFILKKHAILVILFLQNHLIRTEVSNTKEVKKMIAKDLVPLVHLFKSILGNLNGSLSEKEFSSVKRYFTKLVIHRNKKVKSDRNLKTSEKSSRIIE